MTWHREAAECQAASEHGPGRQLHSCLSPGCCLSPTTLHTAPSPSHCSCTPVCSPGTWELGHCWACSHLWPLAFLVPPVCWPPLQQEPRACT